MTPLYLRIANEFKAGNEITTKKIRSIYASSNSHTKITIDFLLRAKAIKKTERKEGALVFMCFSKMLMRKQSN
ncbi:hypothetical protein PR729_19800 [Providencia rettgeri]|nr:hypothetical protein PR729_19800 [Providencia rettgeri]